MISFEQPAPENFYLQLGAPEHPKLTIEAPPDAYQFESRELRVPLAGKTSVMITYTFAQE